MKNKIFYLPKFQDSGTLPKSTEYYGGNLNSAKVFGTLSRDQWNNLYKQGKISLSQIPRKYQSWIEAENSSFKQGNTNAINDFGTKYVFPVILGGVAGPRGMIEGMSNTALDIGINAATKGKKTSWGDLWIDKDKHPIESALLEFTNPLGFISIGSFNKYKTLADLPSVKRMNKIEMDKVIWKHSN